MTENNNTTRPELISLTCPCCQAVLWVEKETGIIVKSAKAPKKKSSLDELLEKEQKRLGEFDKKFDATVSFQLGKKDRADKKFKEVLEKVQTEEEEPE